MAETKEKSPWDIMKTVRLDRAKGENAVQTQLISINERDFFVPRGRPVDVPLPVYEAIELSRCAREKYDINCQEFAKAASAPELK